MTTVSPEVIEKWRSDFELYYSVVNPSKNINRSPDGYHQPHAQQSWFWFNAARQSVVIELPENNSCYDVVHDAIEEIANAIKAQGYQVNFNQPMRG